EVVLASEVRVVGGSGDSAAVVQTGIPLEAVVQMDAVALEAGGRPLRLKRLEDNCGGDGERRWEGCGYL
ncbi:hypothetical protein GW17_00053451, partial [Ensete ventricosum]